MAPKNRELNVEGIYPDTNEEFQRTLQIKGRLPRGFHLEVAPKKKNETDVRNGDQSLAPEDRRAHID